MDSATCAMTRPLPTKRRDGVSGAAPVARSDAIGAGSHALSAGARPNRTPVASDTTDREQQHPEIDLRLNLDVRRHAGHAP